jgi:transcriptional regulator GlxA family with amidase domain
MIGRSAGAFVLGAAGLLDGRPFTTHVEDADELNAGPTGVPCRSRSAGSTTAT